MALFSRILNPARRLAPAMTLLASSAMSSLFAADSIADKASEISETLKTNMEDTSVMAPATQQVSALTTWGIALGIAIIAVVYIFFIIKGITDMRKGGEAGESAQKIFIGLGIGAVAIFAFFMIFFGV
jgi:hypothetical protein